MKNTNPIYILNKTLSLRQIDGGFRTSTDSILLAAACPATSREHILDLGCGVGSAGLCVVKRVKDVHLTGVDIQDDHIDVARLNAKENNLHERSSFSCHDIRDLKDPSLNNIGTFDHVICNPPFKESGAHISSPSDKKALAMGHQDKTLTLQDWITCAWIHIKRQGSLSIIHEAGRTDDILHNLYSPKGGKRFGNVEIFPVFSKSGKSANRVIIRAWKHKKAGSILCRGIVMHNSDGSYTKEAEDVLRHSAPLIF